MLVQDFKNTFITAFIITCNMSLKWGIAAE